ncbi:hypothetical protein [Cohnella silvisoli]|uniref:Lipoprotein n=1 Tax=Cohnella silvisoli TaxID=2873699 RepID=A0ABV1L130_9BACL|nr:hypothetical protein [Cohnella silvisoli]MCD9025220.1 hypothetical protein [Cohnella silvisoli]
MKMKIIGIVLASIIVMNGCSKTTSQVTTQPTVTVAPQETEKIDNGQAIELELQQISNIILAQNYTEANTRIMNSKFFNEDSSYITLQNYAYALLQQKKDKKIFIDYLFKIPKEYSGVLSDQIKDSQKKALDNLVQLAKQGKYEQVVNETAASAQRDGSDVSIAVIHYYAIAKFYESENKPSDVASYLLKIDNNYNGILVDDITKMKDKYYSEMRKIIANEGIAAENATKEEPAIGMTAQEVRDSKWGSPDDINKTTTKYGTSEQWVYNYYGYIYIDDGIVTAIQE